VVSDRVLATIPFDLCYPLSSGAKLQLIGCRCKPALIKAQDLQRLLGQVEWRGGMGLATFYM